MREAESITAEYETAKAQGRKCVLATVVHVEGSSYRRAGARMLVDENGMMTGAISGGCLEGDALRKALHALHQGQNKLVTYDTSDEDDAVIGAQLGCNGIIQVLFEPIDFNDATNAVELLKLAVGSNQKGVIVSLFNLDKSKEQPGTALFIDRDLTVTGNLEYDLVATIKADAQRSLEQKSSQFREYQLGNEHMQAFVELIAPPPTLVLVGAGNDAQILAQMAELLGWRIIVTDGRSSHANKNRFYGSCRVIVSKPERVLDHIRPDEKTVFVLITHNYQYDLAVLKLLLDHPEIPYIGILGPKKKYQRMVDELATEGIQLSREQDSKIHAPVGLELGAETASEIGLSILAEIQAVLTNSSGVQLRTRMEPIHKRTSHFVVTQL